MAEGVNNEPKLNSPVMISDEAIRRLMLEGARYHDEDIKIIGESRAALAKMPAGQTGIVLGSGQNSGAWKERGWKTLDIDPDCGADYVVDANEAELVISTGTQDFICAERIRFNPTGVSGVSPTRLLDQANKLLRLGGTLIIMTAHAEGWVRGTLPMRRWFAEKMTQFGFRTVVELHSIYYHQDGQLEQEVVYYGKKLAEGFDKTRGKLV